MSFDARLKGLSVEVCGPESSMAGVLAKGSEFVKSFD